ncbi:hypothetical protein CAP48_18885 [Advenella sp. S44]|nr:hypothetical protein CAP48_18885 [Advenella sp. S44]
MRPFRRNLPFIGLLSAAAYALVPVITTNPGPWLATIDSANVVTADVLQYKAYHDGKVKRPAAPGFNMLKPV